MNKQQKLTGKKYKYQNFNRFKYDPFVSVSTRTITEFKSLLVESRLKVHVIMRHRLMI